MRRALAFVVPAIAIAACSSPVEHKASRIYSVRNPIIKGTPDTTHTGVAALQSKVVGGQYSSCSGTIIKVTGNTGYYLTAAHCVNDAQFPPALVLLGNNYDTPTKSFPVTSFLAHPQYNGQDHDFGMVTFSGADASTPTYPILTAALDTLAVGSQVEFVGYGVTETNTNNATRYHVVGQLDQLSALTFHYGQANGGPCEGDSGGPAFFTVGGVEYVAGTTSYGDMACQQYGVSSRVSSVQAWIEQYIGGTSQGAGGGTSTGGGGSPGVGGGGSSAGGLCASKGTWGCDPVSATLCGGAGSACDLDTAGAFQCFMPPNDAAIGAPCDGTNGPFCAQGGTCVNKACAKYCCADGDCSAGNTCQPYPGGTSDVGLCAPGVATVGGGGTSSAVGVGGGSAVGVGGGSTFGAGGTSSATGTGGAKTTGGGGTTSAAGATGTGATGAGAGGPTGVGGATTGAGGGKAVGGGAQAGATGTTTGVGGGGDGANTADTPSSGSSGGCAVAAPQGGSSYGAWLGLAGLLLVKRARRRCSAR